MIFSEFEGCGHHNTLTMFPPTTIPINIHRRTRMELILYENNLCGLTKDPRPQSNNFDVEKRFHLDTLCLTITFARSNLFSYTCIILLWNLKIMHSKLVMDPTPWFQGPSTIFSATTFTWVEKWCYLPCQLGSEWAILIMNLLLWFKLINKIDAILVIWSYAMMLSIHFYLIKFLFGT